MGEMSRLIDEWQVIPAKLMMLKFTIRIKFPYMNGLSTALEVRSLTVTKGIKKRKARSAFLFFILSFSSQSVPRAESRGGIRSPTPLHHAKHFPLHMDALLDIS